MTTSSAISTARAIATRSVATDARLARDGIESTTEAAGENREFIAGAKIVAKEAQEKAKKAAEDNEGFFCSIGAAMGFDHDAPELAKDAEYAHADLERAGNMANVYKADLKDLRGRYDQVISQGEEAKGKIRDYVDALKPE